MVKLFLENTEVIIDSTQSIKVTKENPYLTQSESYTLDVSLPLSILQNRQFFGNMQRIDTTKSNREYSARLMNGNDIILEGTARIVQSTDLVVKVQLANGVSALKMSSEQEGEYIDALITEPSVKSWASIDGNVWNSLDYGPIETASHKGYGVILLDRTSDKVLGSCWGRNDHNGYYNVSECPRLIDIAKMIADKLGYEMDLSYLPEACEHMYVISSILGNLGKKLPHWTVKEFLEEFQNFFGCVFVREGGRKLKLEPISNYIDHPERTIYPASGFQVDYSQQNESKGVMSSNLEFSMTESDTEIVEEDILSQATFDETYSTIGETENAFIADSEAVKMRKIYRCNGEIYVGWEKDENVYELRKVAPFNPLVRFEDADSVQLRIAPAYMEEDVECAVFADITSSITGFAKQFKYEATLPLVDNPYGFGRMDEDGSMDGSILQDLIEGSEKITSEEEKSDIMSVAFVDGLEERIKIEADDGSSYSNVPIHLAFTDFNFKKQFTNNRKKWSFSLNELQGYEFYLGQMHKIGFHTEGKVKYIVKFISEAIPSPTDIFIINGKEFACEKIEADIKEGELDNLMTGYFYGLTRS